MNRRHIFAWLAGFAGVARAQDRYDSTSLSRNQFLRKGEAASNNQCPICGAWAEPYRRPMVDKYVGFAHDCKPAGEYTIVCDLPEMIPNPDAPREHLARCQRCNAAFWQDADGGK
jgi:uncharacterized protein with PIN domain